MSEQISFEVELQVASVIRIEVVIEYKRYSIFTCKSKFDRTIDLAVVSHYDIPMLVKLRSHTKDEVLIVPYPDPHLLFVRASDNGKG